MNPFLELAIVLKHEAFLYENEYRLIKSEQNSDNVKFRIGKNLAIPYIEQYFPKEALPARLQALRLYLPFVSLGIQLSTERQR